MLMNKNGHMLHFYDPSTFFSSTKHVFQRNEEYLEKLIKRMEETIIIEIVAEKLFKTVKVTL